MGDVSVIALAPGSVSIPLRPVCATWLGWLVDAGKPRPQDWVEPTGENLKVGA
jgi:hypothetical protein